METGELQNKANRGVLDSPQPKIMKKFDGKVSAKKNASLVFGTVAVIMAGIVTGYFLSGHSSAESGFTETTETSKGVEVSKTEAGIQDVSEETDVEEGILVEGGFDGEGTHHLDRGTGEEKYVYLTSTAFDLQGFVGKKVMIWGTTLSALHAGYLMDVVKIKVID
jgi:hypothetical protein